LQFVSADEAGLLIRGSEVRILPGASADEDGLRDRGEAAVEEILGKVTAEPAGRDGSAQVPIEPRAGHPDVPRPAVDRGRRS
jgi:hypothetical protein